MDFFSIVESEMSRVERELTSALSPCHALAKREIKGLDVNTVGPLRGKEIIPLLDSSRLASLKKGLSDGEMWGLRLLATPVADSEGDKKWIKLSYVWTRMLEALDKRLEVGYLIDAKDSPPLFKRASLEQVPCWGKAFPAHQETEILLWGIGPRAGDALKEALAVEQEFQSSSWDAGGYYQDSPRG